LTGRYCRAPAQASNREIRKLPRKRLGSTSRCRRPITSVASLPRLLAAEHQDVSQTKRLLMSSGATSGTFPMDLLLGLIAEYDARAYFERVGMPDERPCRVWIRFDSDPRSDLGFYEWSDKESCGYIRIGRRELSLGDLS